MTSETHSVGTGVYILSAIWIVTLALCVIAFRTGRLIGVIAFTVSSLITLLLVVIPQGSSFISNTQEVYDRLFVLRYCILTLLIVGALSGLGFFIAYYCMTPIETKKLKNWVN